MTTPQQGITIGQKIRKHRLAQALTQEGLARRANIPYTTLVKIESDAVKNPSIETVSKIAVGLGITVDEVIHGTRNQDSKGV